MAKYRLIVSVSALLGLALVAACDKKSEGETPTPATTATTSAAPAVSTTPAASATVSATAAAASASASASADAAAGDVKLHLDKIKVSSGKIDGVDRHMKSQNNAIKRKCIDPAVKKDPASIDGELKDVVELDGDGKVTKQTTTVTGKVPDDVVACVKKVVEKVEFDTDNGKAKAEMNYKIGPHAEDAPEKK
jgi:hypothetical protein